MKKQGNGGLVYSTEYGRMCPDCGKSSEKCVCGRKKTVSASDGVVRIGRTNKGRGGKTVTIITGIPLDHDALSALAKQLKQKCGTGGTVKDGVVGIQGDHRELLMNMLKDKGYKVKLSGG